MTEEAATTKRCKRPGRRFWFALAGFLILVLPNLALWLSEMDFATGVPTIHGEPAITHFTLFLPAEMMGFHVFRVGPYYYLACTCVLVAWGFLGALAGLFFAWLIPGNRRNAAK